MKHEWLDNIGVSTKESKRRFKAMCLPFSKLYTTTELSQVTKENTHTIVNVHLTNSFSLFVYRKAHAFFLFQREKSLGYMQTTNTVTGVF
mgnify:CR=1 FL=1